MTDRERWNKKYLEKDLDSLSLKPTDFLVKHESLIEGLENRKALDIACGNGHNAFWLAEKGFEVDAVDVSNVALDWIETNKGERNISTHCLDMETENFPSSNYTIILNFYFLNRKLFPLIEKAMAPGALLFFETFYVDQQHIEGRKMNPAYLLESQELTHAFPSLEVLAYTEGIEANGKKAVARLVAKKPLS